jgi:hypothetical protein
MKHTKTPANELNKELKVVKFKIQTNKTNELYLQ